MEHKKSKRNFLIFLAIHLIALSLFSFAQEISSVTIRREADMIKSYALALFLILFVVTYIKFRSLRKKSTGLIQTLEKKVKHFKYKEAVEYAKKCNSLGYDVQFISQSFKDMGWTNEQIEKVLDMSQL